MTKRRIRNRFTRYCAVLIVITVCLVTAAQPNDLIGNPAQDYNQIAVQAYIYGYPLVVLSRLRKLHTLSKQGMEGIRAPINTFAHASRLLNAKDPRDTITPNNDTIQSNAWLDLSAEPQVLQVPAMPGHLANTGGRYYALSFFDAYGNVFKIIGRRVTGNRPGNYLITGPGWSGTPPKGLTQVKAPTNNVWIRGQTYIDLYEDTEKALAMIRKIKLTPFGVFSGNAAPAASSPQGSAASGSPQDIASAGIKFFDEMCEELKTNPPPPSEAQLLAQFQTIGLSPGRVPSTEVKDPPILAALQSAVTTGEKQISAKLDSLEQKVNGWEYTLKSGAYGNDYLLRAAMAKVGPGATVPQEITAALSRTDVSGKPLSGEHDYVIKMDKAHIPPTDASWSLTLYSSADSFFVDNRINRYSINGLTRGIITNTDGSIDIFIQDDPPGSSRQKPNWLPAPKGNFYLVFRTYMPRAEVFSGRYEFPSVQLSGK